MTSNMTEPDVKKTPLLHASQRAMEAFISKDGRIINSTLAEQFKVNRATIGRWRRKDEWDRKLKEMQQEGSKRVAEKMAGKLAANYEAMFATDIEHLKILDQTVAAKLFARDSAGNFLRDAEGKLKINADLSPNDICTLMRAKETKVKVMRLLTGQSTDNQSVNAKVTGRVEHVHKLDNAGMMIEKAAIESLKPGNEGMQTELLKMLECFQNLRVKIEEG
jgi:hypothetical protein